MPTNAFTPGNHGFLVSGGTFTQIDVPGAIGTEVRGINDAGQIVGTFYNSTGPRHGFLDSGGIFTRIDMPGADWTEAYGINDAGQVVGNFQSKSPTHGFLDSGGTFTQIDVPGAQVTLAYGINDAGQIVGTFYNSTGPTPRVPRQWRDLHPNRRARLRYICVWHQRRRADRGGFC